jgi:hypothetical protein
MSNQVSMVNYKADFEKHRGDIGSFGKVALQSPDMKINLRNSEQVSSIKYNQLRENSNYTAKPKVFPGQGSFVQEKSEQVPQSRVYNQREREKESNIVLQDHKEFLNEDNIESRNDYPNEEILESPDKANLDDSKNEQPRALPLESNIIREEVDSGEEDMMFSTYQASFAYNPDAEDELSFEVGDVIIDAQLVAEGWLYGTNQRTGISGLVPEPYCTKV